MTFFSILYRSSIMDLKLVNFHYKVTAHYVFQIDDLTLPVNS